ncbi:hypothetical protein A8W25_08990 [Streptomyces sp. ERV7]|nr:hypothetical protein A8W25_08990 [Streptomyces sp. ERV7]
MRSARSTSESACSPLETDTTRAAGAARSRDRSRPVSAKWPRWFTPNCRSKPSVVLPYGSAITPALLTRRSSVSWRYVSAKARTEDRSARSSGANATFAPYTWRWIRASASLPLASLRQARITWAPLRASSRAVTSPMPLFAPVTTAVRPLWSGMSLALQP